MRTFSNTKWHQRKGGRRRKIMLDSYFFPTVSCACTGSLCVQYYLTNKELYSIKNSIPFFKEWEIRRASNYLGSCMWYQWAASLNLHLITSGASNGLSPRLQTKNLMKKHIVNPWLSGSKWSKWSKNKSLFKWGGGTLLLSCGLLFLLWQFLPKEEHVTFPSFLISALCSSFREFFWFQIFNSLSKYKNQEYKEKGINCKRREGKGKREKCRVDGKKKKEHWLPTPSGAVK